MSRRARGALFTAGALAVLVVALAVSPAVGGPSVSKLAKQLSGLKKQVALIQKQQGPQGPAGTSGQTGAQGPSALKVDYDTPNTGFTIEPIATLNELTVSALCSNAGASTNLQVWAESTVDATLNWTGVTDRNGTLEPGGVFNGGGAVTGGGGLVAVYTMASIGPAAMEFLRTEGQVVYRNANRVITLDLHLIANNITHRCQVQGTAVPAS